jgi:hypothetical protein
MPSAEKVQRIQMSITQHTGKYYNSVTMLHIMRKYLFKSKCKCETKIRGGGLPPMSLAGSKNVKCEMGLIAEIVMMQ